eukprot:5826966-Prymnesium_polylepis.1
MTTARASPAIWNAGGSGQELIVRLHALLGLPLAEDKHEPMSLRCVFLGILHDFTSFAARRVVLMRPKPGRLERVLARLSAIAAAGAILPSESQSLRGKLQFMLATVVFGGRICAGALRAFGQPGPLQARQGSRRSEPSSWPPSRSSSRCFACCPSAPSRCASSFAQSSGEIRRRLVRRHVGALAAVAWRRRLRRLGPSGPPVPPEGPRGGALPLRRPH